MPRRSTPQDDPPRDRQDGAPVAALRVGVAADPTVVDALAGALRRGGLDPLPLAGLDLRGAPPDVILDATGSVAADEVDCPVLRILFPDGAALAAGRLDFVAALAARWASLRRTPPGQRRLALLLGDHPGPAALADTIATLRALADAGYRVEDVPEDGAALTARLAGGRRDACESLLLPDYFAVFHGLPQTLQEGVTARWGSPERDPSFRRGELHCGEFTLSAVRFGNVAVGVQPPGGDGDVPSHAFLAYHAWLQDGLRADVVIHLEPSAGRPDGALILADGGWVEAARGPLPHFWPGGIESPASWPALLRDLGAAQR